MHPHMYIPFLLPFCPFFYLLQELLHSSGRQGFSHGTNMEGWCELLQCFYRIAYFCLLLELHCLRYLLYFLWEMNFGFLNQLSQNKHFHGETHQHSGYFWIPAELCKYTYILTEQRRNKAKWDLVIFQGWSFSSEVTLWYKIFFCQFNIVPMLLHELCSHNKSVCHSTGKKYRILVV